MKLMIKNNILEVEVKNEHIFTSEDCGENVICFENSEFVSGKLNIIKDTMRELTLSWKPDYEKSRLFFLHNENISQLVVEVFPKYLSYKEKNEMLASASKDISEDGYSDYFRAITFLDKIDEIFNAAFPTGMFNFYDITLSQKEQELLDEFK